MGAHVEVQSVSSKHRGDAILVRRGDQRWIIDAKWKRPSTERDKNYELSQADFYQFFAYGHKYLGGTGDIYLV
ncbi:5-methylcytosine restriction system specificity protein McrC [Sinorhizobium medicae]|uniref:5-methylcytosine restriction system specificity protein McrC n=1 Tax=Sinorhizobium medicae TaxID=110321 RepID=UPI0022797605|nr:hypothetical protein [Sinorhizobium medicae]